MKDWRWEQGQVQPGTSGKFWLEGISRSPLPPPTQGSASFKADQVALQAFTVFVDKDSPVFLRDLFQCLTKSPGEEFPFYSLNFPPCTLWPRPLVLLLSNFDTSLSLSSLTPSLDGWAQHSHLPFSFSSVGQIPPVPSVQPTATHSSLRLGSILLKINDTTPFLQRSKPMTSGCHPNYSNDKIMWGFFFSSFCIG